MKAIAMRVAILAVLVVACEKKEQTEVRGPAAAAREMDYDGDEIEGDLKRPDGETVTVKERAPTIDPGNTKQGTTLTQDNLKNVPVAKSYAPLSLPPGQHAVAQAPDAAPPLERAQGPSVDEVWVIARAPRQVAAAPRGIAPALTTTLPKETREIALPLEQTDVHARIAGFIATVEVKQRYRNPYDQKIDVEYVFPLPANAAVSDFLMTVGDRRIRGIVRERAEAVRIYREARAQGHTVSLLTEERPNIFTQKVANIEPQKRIDITLTYDNLLPWEDGAFTFAFPTVVGPRYNPAGFKGGIGAAPRHAPDSSGQKTEVTYLAPGEVSGHRLTMTIELDAGSPLVSVESKTHRIDQQMVSERARRIVLTEMVPDRDFVLRYQAQARPSFFVHQGKDESWFALLVPPPAQLGDLERAPMEMVFVLDCSGSMSGRPLAVAKTAVERALHKLGPQDTFQIVRFSDEASALGPAPVPATPQNVARALRHLESLNGEGGTEMISGIRAALDFAHDQQRLRVVSFLTDGYIGNEADILAAVADKLGSSRLFSFGVGTSVNRFLLEKMAAFGRGAVAFVDLADGAPEEEAALFYDRISHPALADVSVDWGAARVSDVYPTRIPDLVVGRPVIVVGRLRGPLPPRITVRGRAGGKALSYEVATVGGEHPALPKLWARARIGALADRAIVSPEPELHTEARQVALSYGLLSAYTAFVAVDASSKTEGGTAPIVPVAVPVPQGVKYESTVPR